ncbi:hypothetical protein [Streptomyces sp. NPDC001657]|uniref:hypothetical protein n=1 Tax=Streptomyces sp. NPDC001657 TaxID=3154522 RepID=UPI00332D4240
MDLTLDNPVSGLLSRWLPRDVILGREPFDAWTAVKELNDAELRRLILEGDDALSDVRVRDFPDRWDGSLPKGWDLPPLGEGEAAAYVPAGPRMGQRMIHAALYSDRVLVSEPPVPTWLLPTPEMMADQWIWYLVSIGPSDVLRYLSTEDDLADVIRYLDPGGQHADLPSQLHAAFASAAAEIEGRLPEVAQTVLQYLWELERPLAEGWLHVVSGTEFKAGNVEMICRDPEFQAALPARLRDHSALTAWDELMMACGLAQSLGRQHVITFAARDTTELIAVTSRYFTSLPWGRVGLVPPGIPHRRRRIVTVAGGEVERGNWFDELLVGLGPATEYLDMQAACELRQEGTAVSLRRWLTEDLNRVAFSVARGDDHTPVLKECRAQLNTIARAAEARLAQTSSANVQVRLKEAGIWGLSGLFSNFWSVILTGGSLSQAGAVAGVGFGLSAGAGAAGTSAPAAGTTEPVLFDIMQKNAAARHRHGRR